ncbi:DUF2752 domain-containing protein [Luteimonas aquatica]|uniref:DUF2752 domain-containing protein n=1 Tax=Luteimonas aquatica TaxID=450364 RepID=UPI001F5991E2|nr:DUF2752 domain-containing protein [Luteimonas aquatica]
MTASRALQLSLATAAATTAAVGVWVLRNFDPNVPGLFPPCVFHALTGYWCVGCGITRALHALVHGDLARAFSMNPLATALLMLAPLLAAWKLGWQPRWLRPGVALLAEPRLWLVLLPAYWIARNLPWWPFTLLAPG